MTLRHCLFAGFLILTLSTRQVEAGPTRNAPKGPSVTKQAQKDSPSSRFSRVKARFKTKLTVSENQLPPKVSERLKSLTNSVQKDLDLFRVRTGQPHIHDPMLMFRVVTERPVSFRNPDKGRATIWAAAEEYAEAIRGFKLLEARIDHVKSEVMPNTPLFRRRALKTTINKLRSEINAAKRDLDGQLKGSFVSAAKDNTAFMVFTAYSTALIVKPSISMKDAGTMGALGIKGGLR